MSDDYSDRLAGYVDVAERLRRFHEQHPNGSVLTTSCEFITMGEGHGWYVVAEVRRDATTTHADGRGSTVEPFPGRTPYTKGAELENAETSAWGRALGSLGIGIDKSVASSNEVRAKRADRSTEGHTDGDETWATDGRAKARADLWRFVKQNNMNGKEVAADFTFRSDGKYLTNATEEELVGELAHLRGKYGAAE